MNGTQFVCLVRGHDWDTPQQPFERIRCDRCGGKGWWY